jgi:VWFA-related protein
LDCRRNKRDPLLRIPAVLAAVVCTLVAVGVAHGQDPTLALAVVSVTAGEYPDAQLVVNLQDTSTGTPGTIDPTSISITIDGTPAQVSAVDLASSTTSPLDVLLMIDTSGSTESEPLAQAKTAATAFIRSLAPEDRVAIMRFANSVTVQQDFTSDKDAAIAAVSALASRGQTELYKAAAGAINQAATSTSARRAVVLLTDGSQDVVVTDVTYDGAIGLARSTAIPVFTVAQGAAIEDSSFLVDLARASGGRYLEAPSPGALVGVYESIGRLLQSQYLVRFDASEAAGKSQVALKVQVSTGGRTAITETLFQPGEAFVPPTITLIGLASGESLEEPREITVTAGGADAIEKVAYYVDGVNVFETSEPPFTFEYDPDKFGEGEHTLRAGATIGGDIIDGAPVSFSSIPSAPVVTEQPNEGGGSLPILPIAGIVGALAVIGGAFIAFQRFRMASAPSLEVVSPDQRVTPWAARHRAVTKGAAEDDEDARAAIETPPAEEIGEPLGLLISRAGSDLGQEYAVGGKPVSIGSGARCAVRIQDPRLGSEEARIWIRKGTLMLHRMARLTTIATDGVSGGWTMLEPGETFQVGDHVFEFRLLPEGVPLPGSDQQRVVDPNVPNILRDRPDPIPGPMPEPGLADNTPRRLTDMMPRDLGFTDQDLDSPGERAS